MSSARVLLVDDAEAVRLTLGALLEDAGHHVVAAGTLTEGLARMREAPVDLAVIDLNLPDGRGTELIAALEREQPAAVTVLLSGDVGVPGGATLCLTKAGSPLELLSRLQGALARARAR